MIYVETLEELFQKHRSPALTFLDKNRTGDGEWTEGLVDDWFSTKNSIMAKLFMVCNMVLLDAGPKTHTHPIFCHVRYDSSIITDEVSRLYKLNSLRTSNNFLAPEVWLGSNEGESRGQTEKYVVWEGYTKWREQLIVKGIAPHHIKTVGPVYNTPDEHLEIIRVAKENNFEGVNLVGSPYHMVRIALGAVQHMKRVGYWTKMYFNAPKVPAGEWLTVVKGAQGDIIGDGERYNQLFEEHARIPEYMLKEVRDLSTFEDLISYIRIGRESIKDGQLTVPLTPIMSYPPANVFEQMGKFYLGDD